VVATHTISKPEYTTNNAISGDTLSSGGEYSGICPGLLEAGPISPASRFADCVSSYHEDLTGYAK
jgi:hypothetical protein